MYCYRDMYVCMYVRTYVCMHACMYVYIYIYIYTHNSGQTKRCGRAQPLSGGQCLSLSLSLSLCMYVCMCICICYSTDYSQQAGCLLQPGQLSILLPQLAD